MFKIDNITDRISIIKQGNCLPSHLLFNYSKNILITANSIASTKLNIPYRAILRDIIDSIDVLISRPMILRNDKYEVMEIEYDAGNGDKIYNSELFNHEESTGLYFTCSKEEIDKIEDSLKKELNLYKASLEELLGIKPERNTPSKASKKHSRFMIGNFIGDTHMNKIIDFELSLEQPLFLNAKEDKEKIKGLFLFDDIENFHKKGIQIRLGVPLEYAVYFFDSLKKKKVIVSKFQSYIDKSKSLFRENGGQPIDSLNMRTSLCSLNSIRKSNKNGNSEVTVRENTNKIDKYIKRYFTTS